MLSLGEQCRFPRHRQYFYLPLPKLRGFLSFRRKSLSELGSDPCVHRAFQLQSSSSTFCLACVLSGGCRIRIVSQVANDEAGSEAGVRTELSRFSSVLSGAWLFDSDPGFPYSSVEISLRSEPHSQMIGCAIEWLESSRLTLCLSRPLSHRINEATTYYLKYTILTVDSML